MAPNDPVRPSAALDGLRQHRRDKAKHWRTGGIRTPTFRSVGGRGLFRYGLDLRRWENGVTVHRRPLPFAEAVGTLLAPFGAEPSVGWHGGPAAAATIAEHLALIPLTAAAGVAAPLVVAQNAGGLT